MMVFNSRFKENKSARVSSYEGSYSYEHLSDLIDKIENLFLKNKIQPSEIITYKADNSILHLILFLVCEKLQLTLAPRHHRLSKEEDQNYLNKVKPQWLFSGDSLGFELTPWNRHIANPERMTGCLFQTSGTTGQPGLILQSFEKMFINASNAMNTQQMNFHSRLHNVIPFSHIGGYGIQTLAALLAGADIQLQQPYKLDDFAKGLNQATHTAIVPAYLSLLKQSSYFQDFYKNAPLVLTGSSAVPFKTFDELQKKGFQVRSVYGLTEAGPFVSVGEKCLDPIGGAISLLGRPVTGYEFKIHPATNELQIKGSCIGERFNSEERTLSSLLNSEGYLNTGDIAFFRNDEYFYGGRLKNILVVGGNKVNPQEVEMLIASHPSVKECVVIGVPDSRLGEIPKAIVVGNPTNKADLIEFMKEKLVYYKVPRIIEFVEALPRTTLGKVNLSALK